jgi:elongation factor P
MRGIKVSIGITEVAKGMALRVDGDIYTIVDFNHVKPAKGSSFVRIKMRNLRSSNVIERTYRSAESLDDVALEERRMQYLYNADKAYHFMDQTTFEEHVMQADQIEHVIPFLLDNMEIYGYVHDEKVLKMELPNFIVTRIIESDPGLKGDSSKSDGDGSSLY